MKDYSKKIDELTFLKHYLLLENEIEAKYTPDEVHHYPKTEHNIECLDRELKRQLEKIKESYLPFVKSCRTKYTFLTSMWFSFLALNVTIYVLEDEIKYIWYPLFVFGLPTIVRGIQIGQFQKQYTEIKDMEYVAENLSELELDLTDLNLSDSAKEALEISKTISLNNVECFTHKDIKIIKKQKENIKLS